MNLTKNKIEIPQFLVGTSGWSYQHWKDVFYPKDLHYKNWFSFYTQQFSTVEINATFSQNYEDQTYINWYDKAPTNFLYMLKIPKSITHIKKLRNVEKDLQKFYRSASLLNDKLGLFIMQLPPDLKYDPDLLLEVLLQFPDTSKLVIEFRNRFWFNETIMEILKKTGANFCSIDAPSFQLENWVTSKYGYIRLHGKQKWYDYDYKHNDLLRISQTAHKMIANGAQHVFVFFNNDMNGYSAQNALDLSRILHT